MPVKRYDGSNWVTVAGDGAQGPTGPAGASATTVVTTKGDLLTYDTTAARLGVGANDTVLTADSSTATGLKWATPGGVGNMVQIATGTLSGTSVTLSGLSSYEYLYLTLIGVDWATGASKLVLRINNNSGTNVDQIGTQVTTPNWVTAQTSIDLQFSSQTKPSGNTSNAFGIQFSNCKKAGFTDFNFSGGYSYTTAWMIGEGTGIYKVSEAVSSLVLSVAAGYSFNAGTYTLYGA